MVYTIYVVCAQVMFDNITGSILNPNSDATDILFLRMNTRYSITGLNVIPMNDVMGLKLFLGG